MDEISQKFEKMKNMLPQNSFGAADVYQEIVKVSTEQNLNPEIVEKAAKLLGDHIRSSSMFKKQKLAEKVQGFGHSARILLVRQFLQDFSSAFSINECLAVEMFTTDDPFRELVDMFPHLNKPPLECPMVYGMNQKGKLGVESEGPMVTEFRELNFKNHHILDIQIGEEHTVFRVDGPHNERKKYYGCGNEANFLENPESNRKIGPQKLHVPEQPLPVIYMNPDVIPLPTSTLFVNYSNDESLLIARTSEGTRMTAIPRVREPQKTEKQIPVPFQGRILNVNIAEHMNMWQKSPNSAGRVTFFICGRRVELKASESKVKYCENGTVWALLGKSLHRGALVLAPRAAADQSDGPAALVAVMEEVFCPYSIDKFVISHDGKSCIIFPSKDTRSSSDYLDRQFRLDACSLSYRQWQPKKCDLDEELSALEPLLADWTDLMFVCSGLLSGQGRSVIPWLQAVRCFVRFDGSDGILAELRPYVNLGEEEVSVCFFRRVIELLKKEVAVPPLVVAAGFSEEERELRKSQITQKSGEYFQLWISDIRTAVDALDSFSVRYNQPFIVYEIKLQMARMIKQARKIYWTRPAVKKDVELKVNGVKFDEQNVEAMILERTKNGEIDENEDRFAVVRVEAMVCNNYFEKETLHEIFVTKTTLFHVKLVMPMLLELIEDGVLNLNKVCSTVFAPQFFSVLCQSFFGFDREMKTNIFITHDEIWRAALPSDLYTIHTNEGTVVKVPKILFELHSDGYDAARVREAKNMRRDPNQFLMDLTGAQVELLTRLLFDCRLDESTCVRTIAQLLEASRLFRFSRIIPRLVEFIGAHAKENNMTILRTVLAEYPKIVTDSIVDNCPDVLLRWKQLPFVGNYLQTFEKIAERLLMRDMRSTWKNHTIIGETMHENRIIPEWARREENVQLDDEWLRDYLTNGEADDDLRSQFENALPQLNGSNKPQRHSFGRWG